MMYQCEFDLDKYQIQISCMKESTDWNQVNDLNRHIREILIGSGLCPTRDFWCFIVARGVRASWHPYHLVVQFRYEEPFVMAKMVLV